MTAPSAIRLALWSALGASLAVLATLFLFDPTRHGFYPQCALHQLTGLYCPGCGALRATHELLHGRILAAFRLNALFVLSAPPAAYYIGRILYAYIKRTPLPTIIHAGWIWAAAAVVITFGICRNLPVASLAWMRP
jgi:hypothetical protein